MTHDKRAEARQARELEKQAKNKKKEQKPQKLPEVQKSLGESEVRAVLASRKNVNIGTLYFDVRKGKNGKQALVILSSKDPSVSIPESTIREVVADKFDIPRSAAQEKVSLDYEIKQEGKRTLVSFKKAVVAVPLAPEHPDQSEHFFTTKIIKVRNPSSALG